MNFNQILITGLLAVVLLAGVFLFFLIGPSQEEFSLIPQGKMQEAGESSSTEVGTGWSIEENPEDAVKEALSMALKNKITKIPDFIIVFASSGSDTQAILSNIRKMLGDKPKLYGGTSDSRAVMTDKGFVKVTERAYEYAEMEGKRGLAIMTISSKDIIFGAGSANFSAYSSLQEASKQALLQAIKSAGKSPEELPKLILTTPTIGTEEEVIEGIESVSGKNTPIIGGTAGGPKQSVFGKDKAYDKGVSLAVIYTDLPIGWAFEGGFDVTDSHSGIVTKTNGQEIIEIDGQPALDKYDEWLQGKIKKLYEENKKPDEIRDLLTLHPIYRKYTSPDGNSYFLFSHPWPKDDTLVEKGIMTSTKIKAGEKIYLSHGTWETFINRIGNLPRDAKIKGNMDINKKPLFGIGYICGGVMGTIPETERYKLPLLINYENNNAPFIAPFTWGEQGQFPGIGNKHGNLLTPFIVIGND